MSIKYNLENNDIIDKFILEGKGVNVLIPKDQYNYIHNKYTHIYSIVLVQFNQSHEV